MAITTKTTISIPYCVGLVAVAFAVGTWTTNISHGLISLKENVTASDKFFKEMALINESFSGLKLSVEDLRIDLEGHIKRHQ